MAIGNNNRERWQIRPEKDKSLFFSTNLLAMVKKRICAILVVKADHNICNWTNQLQG
jgi:hypothetical protein